MVRRLAMLLAAAALLAAAPAEPPPAEPPPEPSDYRAEQYGAPTPATLRGARVLSAAEAHVLWADHAAVFVDVLPLVPRPANLPAGTIWHQRPHEGIPGSLWLPDTGYGALAPAMQSYLEQGLSEATNGDRDQTLVIYCKPDCWMSWNAAKRALALGYTHVDWYPDGVFGWQAAGYPVEVRAPRPRPGE